MYQVFNPSISSQGPKLKELISKIERVFQTRGPVEGILYVKELRTVLWNYLSNSPIRSSKVSVTKDGIPKALGDLVPNIRKGDSPALLQFLNTILCATRALKTSKKLDTSTITEEPKVVIPDISKHASSFWAELGYSSRARDVPKSLRFKKYHFTTKSGPNGHALWSSLRDLLALPESLVESIVTVGGDVIKSRIASLKEAVIKIPELGLLLDLRPGTRFRRITYFPDKENKMRVVAVGDYFSQTVLRPLHSYLFRVLRKIPQDCTFNQGGFKALVNNDPNRVFYSIDLTAATDRFPIKVISQVLGARLPASYISAWEDIMVGYPFECDGNQLRYAVGNPMGFYSSWASFAVAHHYLIYYCCKEVGKDWRTLPYALLGDDIVIADKEVGEYYRRLIKEIGVDYSPTKTYISSQFLEFAKRLVWKGQEITPFPISALSESLQRYYIFVHTMMEVEKRGWVTIDGIPVSIALAYGTILLRPSRFKKIIEEKSHACEQIMKVIRGAIEASVCIEQIAGFIGIQIPPNILRHRNWPKIAKTQFEFIAVETFADSNPENNKFKEASEVPLGQIAVNLVCFFTSFEDERAGLAFDLIYATPLLGCYGLIEAMFIDLKKSALKIAQTGVDWPLLLKTMALPLDDRIFVQRTSHLISRGSAMMGVRLKTKLTELIGMVREFPEMMEY